ncbi:hypothetical protein vseg_001050 [Gypsophila vaccaria]
MEGKSIVVCIVVAILGLISTAVGLVFELAPDKTMVRLFHFSWSYDDYCTGTDCLQCEYFRSTAFFMVLGSLICVILTQIIITISTDCGCCSGRRSSSALPALAIIAFVFSWLASIAAIIVYLIGGATQYGVQFPEFGHFFTSLSSIRADNAHCYKVKHGIFGAAAALSFCAVTLGIITYLVLVLGDNRRRMPRVSSTTDLHNQCTTSSPMDNPIAIALPDVPATPVRRFKAAEQHQTPTDFRPTPVMLQV